MYNRNNCKLSYCTMPNLHQIISGHNKKLVKKPEVEIRNPDENCNCQKGIQSCPMEGDCLEAGIVYEAEVNAERKQIKKYDKNMSACTSPLDKSNNFLSLIVTC